VDQVKRHHTVYLTKDELVPQDFEKLERYYRQTGRQTNRQTDRQTDGRTERQEDRQADRCD